MGNILIDKLKPEEYGYAEKVNEIKKEIKNLDKSIYENFNQIKSLDHKIENLWDSLEKQNGQIEKNLSILINEDSKQIKNDIEGLKEILLDATKRINITNNNGKIRAENIIESIKENIKFHIYVLYILIGADIIFRLFA